MFSEVFKVQPGYGSGALLYACFGPPAGMICAGIRHGMYVESLLGSCSQCGSRPHIHDSSDASMRQASRTLNNHRHKAGCREFEAYCVSQLKTEMLGLGARLRLAFRFHACNTVIGTSSCSHGGLGVSSAAML